MFEWIVIGCIAIAIIDGILKAAKARRPSMPAPTPPPKPTLPPLETEEEEKRRLAAWDARFAAEFDQDRWIPASVAHRFSSQYPRPRRVSSLVALTTRHKAQQLGLPDPYGAIGQFNAHNRAVLKRQKIELKPFFDTVEKSPLTDEQVHACICIDDHVLIVAAAGSGKTSTMVAKVGYLLRQGLAKPDQILLLAFNRAAADELGERVKERLANFPGVDEITASTFDGFGLSVIGEATGEKPPVAKWVSDGEDIAEVINIAQALGASDPKFKQDWDLFRTVYARDVGKVGERSDPEDFDGKRRGFRTADGKIVKSKEELRISNWLFYNGVNYAYEAAYEHDTASPQHSQYHPDFYYPDIGLYHEHFALDEQGRAPAHFSGDYVAGVHWKRALHAEKGTALFETTSAEIRSDVALRRLEATLLSHGVTLGFDASRETVGPPPMTDQQLASTIRVFQRHMKSNRLSHAQLDHSASQQALFGQDHRVRLFLKLYERVATEWEQRLRQGGCIDFEDMLRLAADHIEAGRYESPFKVIFADEFQDSSQARVRLLQALTRKSEDVHLTVVGDDWQGVNRFAGADLRAMSEFGSFFSHSTTLQLTTTFRCPQILCDISSEFVQANPKQLKKTVRSTSPYDNRPLQAFGFKNLAIADDHIEQQLGHMAKLLGEGRLQAGKDGLTTVLLLGRYKNDRPKRLARWQRMFKDQLTITFKTVHASKGLEAEYVYVLGLIEGRRGFPSQIEDDPVLQLAMPDAETFAMAEERRLFYVALTRARRQVRLYTSLEKPSRFVTELASQDRVVVEPVDGEALETCPKCQTGVLKQRTSGYAPFLGCSRYPQCDFKRSIEDEGANSAPVVRLVHPVALESECPTCGTGKMRLFEGKHGKFAGCSAFPSCKTTGPLG